MRPIALPLMLLALAGCTIDFDRKFDMTKPGYLGVQIDQPAPPVQMIQPNPRPALIGSAIMPDIPDNTVDSVIGPALRDWLTVEERRNLAVASERAAIDAVGTTFAWQAQDGGEKVTATGTATAVGGVYRALRGRVCRDVRQTFSKDDQSHAQTLTLCREEIGSGVALWVTTAVN